MEVMQTMLCSNCNKNTAVIFVNKIDGDKKTVEGLCYSCAKEKGINPIDILSKQTNMSESDLENMSKQFEDIFSDISDDLFNEENIDKIDNSPSSLGSFMSNIFGPKDRKISR